MQRKNLYIVGLGELLVFTESQSIVFQAVETLAFRSLHVRFILYTHTHMYTYTCKRAKAHMQHTRVIALRKVVLLCCRVGKFFAGGSLTFRWYIYGICIGKRVVGYSRFCGCWHVCERSTISRGFIVCDGSIIGYDYVRVYTYTIWIIINIEVGAVKLTRN